MGFERGLNRVRHVLTPKRRGKNENADPEQPVLLSGKVIFAFSNRAFLDNIAV